MTTTEILTGIKNWVLSKLNLKQDVINDLAAIRSGSQAGSTAVQPSDLSSYFNDASYDTSTHRINFYHGQNIVAYVDASPFIVDGMVDDVRIENGYLVIDFNTASGKQDISIPLTDIFNPNNYYNKTQTDGLLAQKQDVIQDLADIRSGASAGSTAVQPSDMESAIEETKEEIVEDVEDNYAKKDGAYETLLAGSALNLQGQQVSQNNSMYRTTAGSEDVASGIAELVSVKGNTIAWNQLIQNGDFSDGKTGWKNTYIATEVNEINQLVVKRGAPSNNQLYQQVTITKGHVYYVSAYCDNMRNDISVRFGLNASPVITGNYQSIMSFPEYCHIKRSSIVTANNNYERLYFLKVTPLGVNGVIIYTIDNIQLIDLTLIYGSGNEPTLEQFEADYFKWFGKPLTYEPYDAGSLRPVMIGGLKVVGFNQYNSESGLVKAMIGEQYQITGTYTKVWESDDKAPTFAEYTYGNYVRGEGLYSINGNFYKGAFQVLTHSDNITYQSNDCVLYDGSVYKANVINAGEWDATKWDLIADVAAMVTEGIFVPMDITPDSNGIFTPTKFYVHVEGGNATDTCVHLIGNGSRNGTYEPYWEKLASVPVTTLKGKLNGEGNSVVVFPDGMKRVNDIYDEIVVRDGKTWAIKRVGSVDLGSRTWTWYQEDKHSMWSNTLTSIKTGGTSYVPNLLAIGYEAVSSNTINNSIYTVPCVSCSSFASGKKILIRNVAYSDTAAFAASLNGVLLYYELATPRVYILDDFEMPVNYKVEDGGTEEIVNPVGEPEGTLTGSAPTLGIRYSVDVLERLEGFVSAKKAQSFTSTEKTQARSNIGAMVDTTIDNAPADGSANLISSGAVLTHGNALDVSVLNADTSTTPDTLATYADLSAAIAAVPVANRTGGMSIKFVLSSDNKYVRFNYLLEDATTNSKFTDVANWQKIVDEEEISTFKFNYGNITALPIGMSYGYIKCNGAAGTTVDLTPVSHSTYKYAVVACAPGDVFYIIGYGGNSDRLYCFVTSDDKVISSAYSNQNQQTYLRVVAPSGSAKIILNDETGIAVSYHGEKSFIANSDDIPTPESNNLVKSGGVARYANTAYFVGKGNNYVTIEYGTMIAGHTYRIYPVLRSWDYATTSSAAYIFAISYTKTDDSVAELYGRKYGTGSPLKEYIDVTIPNDIKDNTGLIIGGRAASGLKVWFVIEDITYINQINDALEPKIQRVNDIIITYGDAVDGEVYATGGAGRTRGNVYKKTGWRRNVSFIRCSKGDSITYIIGGSSSSSDGLIIYDSSKSLISYYSATNKTTNDSRTITVNDENAAYIRASYYHELTNGNENVNPILINGEIPLLEDGTLFDGRVITEGLEDKVDDIEDELHPSLPAYGEIGKNYAEQIPDIVDKLSYRLSNRFHFLHLSDNHNTTYGYANELLDYIPAKFLINTGDLVNDKFSDSKANTIACSISPTKPVYLVLGNHDYSHAPSRQDVFDAFYGDDETEGTVNYHNVQTGGVATDKTYYSVDFATEGIKCIMLDINDGQLDSELPDLGPNALGLGRMSQTQINWFVNELQDAITNNLHVCIFIHNLPVVYSTDRSKRIEEFFDRTYAASGVCCTNLTFLCDIVDAFIDGESVSFSYDGNSYSFTFSTAGHLVAWFAGHTHYDAAGWLMEHENQFAINICRPTKNSSNDFGSYDGDRLGVHFNYVTVDKGLKSLSIYRVGQQNTIYATQRKSFRILYK